MEHNQTKKYLDHFRRAVEAASDAIGMSTPDGHHWYQNKAFDDLFGNIGDDPPASLYTDEKVGRQVFKTIMAGGHWTGEVIMRGKNGNLLNIFLRAYAVKDNDGKTIGLVGVHTDMTKEKQDLGVLHLQHDLGIALSGVTNLKESLTLIVETAVKIPTMDSGGVYIVDQDTKALNLIYSQGLSPLFVDKVSHYEKGSEQAEIISKGRPTYAEYTQLEISKDPVKQNENLHAIAIIPILYQGEAIGALNIASHSESRISSSTREYLETIASQVGSAIMRVTIEDKIFRQNRDLQVLSNNLQKEIDEHIRTEKTLKEEKERFRILFEESPLGVSLIKDNGQYRYINSKFIEMFGYTLEDISTGREWFRKAFPDRGYRKKVLSTWKKDKEESRAGEARPRTFTVNCKDGSKIEILFRPVSLYAEDQLVMYEDITERKRAEEALRDSEERYRLLFNKANDAVFVHQPSEGGKPRNFIEVNDVACKMYGYTREELLELSPLDLVISGQEEEARTWVRKLLSDKYIFFEIVHKTKDGKEIPVEINAHLFDYKSRPTILSIARDITERKRTETRLQQSQKMEAIGTLAGGIAHDFNNILSPLLGYAELLKYDLSDDSPFRGSVDEILRASLRARDLVQQILAFSRQTEDELKPIKIQPDVEEAIKLLRSSLPKTIEMEQDIDSNCGAIFADPTQIHQIVMNLATNAYHAMKDSGGSLKVTLKPFQIKPDQSELIGLMPGTYVCLTVSDTGVGIEKDILDKIFNPYFTTKEKGKGTGLGLSVVHGIVKSYDGNIHITSEPGKGTEVHVYLPIIEFKVEENTHGSIESIHGGTEKILLVDDEEAIVRMEQQMLEQLGYKVITRTGSVDALEAFKANHDRYDLIVTDMTMPNMTGIQLAQEIKKIRPEIPVIISTGFSDQIDDEKCKAMGFQGYVMKPLVRKYFAGIIREVLDRAAVY
jgi:PAS domain S-box-containing protein